METEASKSKAFPRRALISLAVVFLLGVITGAGGVAIVLKHSLQTVMTSDERPMPVLRALDRIESNLNQKLDLTPDQRAALRAELQQTGRTVFTLRNDAFDQLKVEVEESLYRIEIGLPEEKREKFNDIARKRLEPWGFY